MSKRKPAYRIEADETLCWRIGSRPTWQLIGPDGANHGIFEIRKNAEAVASELNRAYDLGRKSAEKKPAKGRAKC